MTGTLVIQSHRRGIPAWIERCVRILREWAGAAGHEYEWLGDELLDLAPAVVREKATSVLPVTDAARLVALRDRLAAGRHERVVWIDADVLVFAPEHLDVALDAPLAVCDEIWVTGGHHGELRAVRYVNNAFLVASDPAPIEELLAEGVRVAAEVDRLDHRALGPDLLTPRHRRTPYPTVPGAALCSPHVVRDLAAGGNGPALRLLLQHLDHPIGAVNLCASMGEPDAVYEAAMVRLPAMADVITDLTDDQITTTWRRTDPVTMAGDDDATDAGDATDADDAADDDASDSGGDDDASDADGDADQSDS